MGENESKFLVAKVQNISSYLNNQICKFFLVYIQDMADIS